MVVIEIKKIRKELGLTQKEFSDKIGIVQSYLSELETGRRSLSKEVMKKLQDTLGEEIISRYSIDVKDNSKVVYENVSGVATNNSGTIHGHSLNITGSHEFEKIVDKDKIELIRVGTANKEYLQRIDSLEKELSNLKAIIQSKEEVISSLTREIETKNELISILKAKG